MRVNRHGQMHGGLGVGELKKQLREFQGDLRDCDDLDQFIALLESAKGILEQCKTYQSLWWQGSGTHDEYSILNQINQKREDLTNEDV